MYALFSSQIVRKTQTCITIKGNSQNVLKIKVNWTHTLVCTMKLTTLPRLWIISQNKHNLQNSY